MDCEFTFVVGPVLVAPNLKVSWFDIVPPPRTHSNRGPAKPLMTVWAFEKTDCQY